MNVFPLGWQAVQAVWKIEPQLLVYLGNSMRTEESTHTFARGHTQPPPRTSSPSTLCLPSSRSYHRTHSKRRFCLPRTFLMLKRGGGECPNAPLQAGDSVVAQSHKQPIFSPECFLISTAVTWAVPLLGQSPLTWLSASSRINTGSLDGIIG